VVVELPAMGPHGLNKKSRIKGGLAHLPCTRPEELKS